MYPGPANEVICRMNLRTRWEQLEAEILSPWGTKSAETRGRAREEPECTVRTAFQRDRDRIIHCKSFRRLKHKTQVLLLPEGDHYRTRLTHTLEVAQIARTISRALGLNEDLTEAIALGHDLGHTPFGHMGERTLRELAEEYGLPPFRHAAQSLRVVEHLEKKGQGLNLTWEVRNGILYHSKGQIDVRHGFTQNVPATHEGWVVRIADSVAYLNHDLDDALRGGILRTAQVPSGIIRDLGDSHGDRIDTIVTDIIQQSGAEGITMSAPIMETVEQLRHFLYEQVYSGQRANRERPKVRHVLRTLFFHLLQGESRETATAIQELIDFLSGMTDRYALHYFQQIAMPSPWPLQRFPD